MKNLLLALSASAILTSCHCVWTVNDNRDTIFSLGKEPISVQINYEQQLKLKIGDSFYFGYADELIETFTVVSATKTGVIVSCKEDDRKQMIPFHDLYYSHNFKILAK